LLNAEIGFGSIFQRFLFKSVAGNVAIFFVATLTSLA
jgi:hypothetical protein